MRIIKINPLQDNQAAILEALTVLRQGGVIVYPTDTVYGLGANACDFKAVDQIYKIKERPYSKPISIIARNMKWVKELAFMPSRVENWLEQIWPGPVTVILHKKKILPSVLTADLDKVGIRIPDYFFTERLLAKFGYPLTATSANLSGEETSADLKKIIFAFKDKLWKPDLVIDAGKLPRMKPSTILDLSSLRPKILRVGPTQPEELRKILGVKL